VEREIGISFEFRVSGFVLEPVALSERVRVREILGMKKSSALL
jgi:hypothetical protein